MIGMEGYGVDQCIHARLYGLGQLTGFFAVKNDNLRTAFDEIVW